MVRTAPFEVQGTDDVSDLIIKQMEKKTSEVLGFPDVRKQ